MRTQDLALRQERRQPPRSASASWPTTANPAKHFTSGEPDRTCNSSFRSIRLGNVRGWVVEPVAKGKSRKSPWLSVKLHLIEYRRVPSKKCQVPIYLHQSPAMGAGGPCNQRQSWHQVQPPSAFLASARMAAAANASPTGLWSRFAGCCALKSRHSIRRLLPLSRDVPGRFCGQAWP